MSTRRGHARRAVGDHVFVNREPGRWMLVGRPDVVMFSDANRAWFLDKAGVTTPLGPSFNVALRQAGQVLDA